VVELDYPPSFLDRVEDAVPPGPQALTEAQSAAPPTGPVAVASAAPYPEDLSEMPISEASGHLDEVADESAATGEVIYLTRDGRSKPGVRVPDLRGPGRSHR
jgi:hypothetical protein